jgi:hypothetical protein
MSTDFPEGVGWTVTRVEPDQVNFDMPGDPQYGIHVYFATAKGNQGVVFIANGHIQPKLIHGVLAQKARLLDEVASLASHSFPNG